MFATDLLGVCVERHSQVQQQLPLLHPLDEGLQAHDNDDDNTFVYKPLELHTLLYPLLIVCFTKKHVFCSFLHVEKILVIDLIFRTHNEKLFRLFG